MLTPKFKREIKAALLNKKHWALLVILGVGAFLRLWNIDSLFNCFEEYDEAVLSLQARFIADGFLPYIDFTLVHPPFYYLVLAPIYKIFDYNLFYAKYLSVFFSLASIFFIYLTGNKLYHTGAALVAAALFAVSPDMVYIGRRVEQEALGIFLVILAIYFAARFIIDGKKGALVFSGLALGLALSTKYLFAPAVLAVFITLIIYLMGESFWEKLKRLVRPSFLLVYALLTAIAFLLIFFICRTFNFSISVPWFDYGDFSTGSIFLACIIFVLTLFLTILIFYKRLCFREWWQRLCVVMGLREVWYMAFGVLFAFIAVTGYFLLTPKEFLYQTLILQDSRLTDFPSLISMLRGSLVSWEYLKIAFLTGLLSLPVAILILNKKTVSCIEYSIAMAILSVFVFCQFLGGVPRYYYSAYPLLLLGLAAFVPDNPGLISADIKSFTSDIKIKLIGISAVMLVFFGVSIMIITNYPGYDYGTPRLTNDEGYIYQKTIDYLESVSPTKVYAANPIFLALSHNLRFNTEVDTFALLKLEKQSAEQLILDNIENGADYFILDYWVRNISTKGEMYDELEQAISQHARLVQRIGAGSINYIEIYQLVPEGETILNPDFSQWARGEFTLVPSGWQSVLLVGDGDDGDAVTISEATIEGRRCVRLEVQEDGLPDDNRTLTYCRIQQAIPFPENSLNIEIMPTFDAISSEGDKTKSGIAFSSGGNTLMVIFSDDIITEQFIQSDNNLITVVRPAKLGSWSEETFDLASYWARAGWGSADEVNVSFFISAYATNPGKYDLFIANIGGK